MSAAIELRYVNGRAHGTPWGASHNEGRIEFPPSPWRVTRALLATWFERAPELPEAIVRSLLEKLTDVHPTYVVPPFAGAHVRHYLPESAHKAGVSTATAKVLDAFAAVDPDTPLVVEWEVELADDERKALGTLVERMPYIGRAESLIDGCLVDTVTERAEVADSRRLEARAPEAGDRAVVRLLCGLAPFDWSAALEVPWRLRQKGFIDPPSTERVLFTSTAPLEWNTNVLPVERPAASVRAIEWRIRGKGAIPLTAAVAYGDVLRQAIIKRASDAGATLDWRFLGRDGETRTDRHHQHSHFLPIEDQNRPGFVGGLLLWTPFELGIDEAVADAALSVTRLWAGGSDGGERAGLRDFRPVGLFVQRFGDPAERAQLWTHLPAFQSAAAWETLTPYAPARHLRSDGRMLRSLEAEVARELVERGFPAPSSVELLGGSDEGRTHPLQFRRHRANKNEHLRDGRRAYHIRLRFKETVSGPIAIGALSHFGLGVFVPVKPKQDGLSSAEAPDDGSVRGRS